MIVLMIVEMFLTMIVVMILAMIVAMIVVMIVHHSGPLIFLNNSDPHILLRNFCSWIWKFKHDIHGVQGQ